jgi:hypothetical protein
MQRQHRQVIIKRILLPEVILHLVVLLRTGQGLTQGVLGIQGGSRYQDRVKGGSKSMRTEYWQAL